MVLGITPSTKFVYSLSTYIEYTCFLAKKIVNEWKRKHEIEKIIRRRKIRNECFMDKIGKTKLSMAKLGWNIEERISDDGWGDSIGYRIWFNN